jgi:hypothetical protein
LAKAKRILKWQRDPEGMRIRIPAAAKQEFAAHGLAGAWVDRIAAKAGPNKRIRHVCEDAPYKYTLLEGAKGVQLAECALQSWRERRWIDVAPIKV